MAVVYHGVPKDMVGSVLYPLNALREVSPVAYEFQKAKYQGREATMDFRIPRLDLLFNDTVHCAPLHPHHLFNARRALGMEDSSGGEGSWLTGFFYAIPLERILAHWVVWYSCKTLWISGAPNQDVPLVPPPEEFEPFDPRQYTELTEPTLAHLSYLASMKERCQRPLMFVHIPHVLVAGPIDVSGLAAIPWSETRKHSPRYT